MNDMLEQAHTVLDRPCKEGESWKESVVPDLAKEIIDCHAQLEAVRNLPRYGFLGSKPVRALYGKSTKDANTGRVSDLYVKSTDLEEALQPAQEQSGD